MKMQKVIVKGNWIDTPYRKGFKEEPGIFLLMAGSNSAYAGFESVAEAEEYNQNVLGGTFQVFERK
jgi:hypothetical protein